ncbi:ABC transporter ATP-binding protein [Inconstantimicrobium porci]|uniref:ABC transporter ATP-binding protein n=1 Tax=Inconstantimicrobium porci TaxID=2652291 RepID=UPI0024093E5B|nr:ABC transporter ATP-binding protein [Inconstantimicrobium porci]MDD6770783.1 ABC transporter ATP-binding protein [Inconstantimicrobium porci]
MKYFRDIISKNRLLIISYIVAGVLIAFFDNFNAHYYQKLIDSFTDGSLSIKNIIVYGCALFFLCIINYYDEYPGNKLENGIFEDFKIKALKKISVIDYEAYEKLGTGKLIQRIENGSEAGKGILFDFYFCVIRQLIPSIIFSLIFMYNIDKKIMMIILLSYVVVFVVTNILLKVLYKIKERILYNEEQMNHYMVRGFMEMVVFRVNKRFTYEIKKAENAKNIVVNSKVKMKLIHEAFFTIFALIVVFIKIFIIYYGWKYKAISIGSIIALVALVDNAYTPIAIFNVLFVQYKLDKTAFSRYEKFLDLNDDKKLSAGEEIDMINGQISIKNVSFSYGSRDVLKNVSTEIKCGQNTALVGESGSGKSTLIKMIIGLLKVKKGTINVDGYDLSKLKLESFYDYVSYISQETPIFDGTLRENIIFDKKADDKEIVDVLKKVQLYELYEKLEDRLDTKVGERGITLSGGERQRLALARLWFDDKKIVILDEATSAMDNITEEKVMLELTRFLKDKTLIVIAHRLSTIVDFDNIIVFKEGQILANGTFNDLLSNNKYFNELYNRDKLSVEK